jgi:hypothetical protein
MQGHVPPRAVLPLQSDGVSNAFYLRRLTKDNCVCLARDFFFSVSGSPSDNETPRLNATSSHTIPALVINCNWHIQQEWCLVANCTTATARKRRETSDGESGERGNTPGRHAGCDVHQTTNAVHDVTLRWVVVAPLLVRLWAGLWSCLQMHVRCSNFREQTNSDRACLCVCNLNDYNTSVKVTV